MFASHELFANRNMEISNSKVEFKMHRKAWCQKTCQDMWAVHVLSLGVDKEI